MFNIEKKYCFIGLITLGQIIKKGKEKMPMFYGYSSIP